MYLHDALFFEFNADGIATTEILSFAYVEVLGLSA